MLFGWEKGIGKCQKCCQEAKRSFDWSLWRFIQNWSIQRIWNGQSYRKNWKSWNKKGKAFLITTIRWSIFFYLKRGNILSRTKFWNAWKEEKKEEEDKTVYMRMTTIKKGKGETKPMKGQKVGCYYKGHLDNQDGKIFDQLQPKARGSQPLSFKGTRI